MGQTRGESLSGRRRVRGDAEALRASVPGYKVIHLGPMYLKIVLDMIAEFTSGGGVPISQVKRDEIIARHTSKSPGSVIMGQLRSKGAFEAVGPGATHPVDVVPRHLDVIYVRSRTEVIAWPREHEGKTLEVLLEELGTARSAPMSSSPDPEPVLAPPLAPSSAASRAPLVKHGESVMLGEMSALYYEAVMEAARARGYAALSPPDLHAVYLAANPQVMNPADVTYQLSRLGLLEREGGLTAGVAIMRVVVFRRSCIRSGSQVGEEMVPPEVAALAPVQQTAESDSSARERVEESTPEPMPVSPAIIQPDPPAPGYASATDAMRERLEERLAQLQQGKRDIDELEREQEQRAQLASELEQLQSQIREIDATMAERRARIAALNL